MTSSRQRVLILSGSELRHSFFRRYVGLDPQLEVVRSFCEGSEKSLKTVVEGGEDNALRLMHLQAREQSEADFFQLFLENTQDLSRPVTLPKGEVNSARTVSEIIALKPDLVICYGASIIREPLLSAFRGRFLNIHLGLSPYYRGSGTNYWPLVNGQPEFVGTTFMHIDAGVDTGEVIHQIHARISPGDTPVQIGNRLIIDTARLCREIAVRWNKLDPMPQIPRSPEDRIYRKKDYTENSVHQLYDNFSRGLIARYLEEKTERCAAVRLIRNPGLCDVE